MLLLYMAYTNEDILEYYDYEITDISATECGTECTEGINCLGFGYNHKKRKCYLSKTAIIGEPNVGLYKDQYTKLDKRCNKINRLRDSKRIDSNSLIENSIYVCSDGENNIVTEFQYANQGATSLEGIRSTIYDRSNADIALPVNVKYETHEIQWPEKRESGTSRLEKNDKKKYGFIESNKEFLGQYTLPHQCVVNIPFYDCLKYCENDPECTGTEWNKSLKDFNNNISENVCCPKSFIKKIIPRRKEYGMGNFYVKTDLHDILNRDNIVLTKADYTKKI